MRTTRSARLFSRAFQILPGGVDSPVRAFKAVGGSPLFIRRASGSRIEDVDGNTFIDYVMSWGPLIHGHAPRGLVKALAAAARDGTSFGAPSPLEIELGARVMKLMPSIERVRFVNSGTEATMSAIRVARAATRARADREVRRLLSRTCRSVSGEGRLGGADARRADQPRRHARRRRRHAGGRLQRRRVGAASVRRPSRPDRRGHRGADRRQHGRRPARGRFSARASRGVHGRKVGLDLRRGDFGIPRRSGRRAAAGGRPARSDVPRQDHRRRAAGGRLWRTRRSDGARVAGRARSIRPGR